MLSPTYTLPKNKIKTRHRENKAENKRVSPKFKLNSSPKSGGKLEFPLSYKSLQNSYFRHSKTDLEV